MSKKNKKRHAATPQVATPAAKDRHLAVSDGVAFRAKARPVRVLSPFRPAIPPNSVIPKGAEIALDSAMTETLDWGMSSLGAVSYADGGFLGYPTLALLAQVPEYRRISETLATEMTRQWIRIQSTGEEDKTDRIRAIETELHRLKVRDVFRKAAEQDGFFGRSHIFVDLGVTEDRDELKTPIGSGRDGTSKAKIGKGNLSALRVVEAVWCYPSSYNAADPLRSEWYSPASWFVQGAEVHATRLLTLVGREVPDLLKPAYSFGGLSLSQMAKPYVDNWLRTRQSVSDLLHSFSVSGVKIDLVQAIEAGDQATGLYNRVDLFTAMRDNRGTMVLDKDEEFFNVSTPLSGLDALQAQSQEHMAAVSGIPIVKLLGIQPAGLNASSEGEIRSFYDWIEAFQEKLFRAPLTTVLDIVQLSLFGEVDPTITFAFEPLWSLDEESAASVRKTDAETGEILIRSNVITADEERRRVSSDAETIYASLDDQAPAVPELTPIEAAQVAQALTAAVAQAFEAGIVEKAAALKELQAVGSETGTWSSIDAEDISDAENDPPGPGEVLPDPSAAPGGNGRAEGEGQLGMEEGA